MGTAVGYIRGTVFDFVIFGVMMKNSHWINIVIVGADQLLHLLFPVQMVDRQV